MADYKPMLQILQQTLAVIEESHTKMMFNQDLKNIVPFHFNGITILADHFDMKNGKYSLSKEGCEFAYNISYRKIKNAVVKEIGFWTEFIEYYEMGESIFKKQVENVTKPFYEAVRKIAIETSAGYELIECVFKNPFSNKRKNNLKRIYANNGGSAY